VTTSFCSDAGLVLPLAPRFSMLFKIENSLAPRARYDFNSGRYGGWSFNTRLHLRVSQKLIRRASCALAHVRPELEVAKVAEVGLVVGFNK
jgi:hypothetical protein